MESCLHNLIVFVLATSLKSLAFRREFSLQYARKPTVLRKGAEIYRIWHSLVFVENGGPVFVAVVMMKTPYKNGVGWGWGWGGVTGCIHINISIQPDKPM